MFIYYSLILKFIILLVFWDHCPENYCMHNTQTHTKEKTGQKSHPQYTFSLVTHHWRMQTISEKTQGNKSKVISILSRCSVESHTERLIL